MDVKQQPLLLPVTNASSFVIPPRYTHNIKCYFHNESDTEVETEVGTEIILRVYFNNLLEAMCQRNIFVLICVLYNYAQ